MKTPGRKLTYCIIHLSVRNNFLFTDETEYAEPEK